MPDAGKPVHEFGPDDLCRACGKRECSDAFWAMFGAPPGTSGLRLRPNEEPRFLTTEETWGKKDE